MGADSPAENTPNASKIFQTKMSAQAQKFKIFEKSYFWVSVVRGMNNGKTPLKDPLERLLEKTLQGISAVKILWGLSMGCLQIVSF